MILEGRVNTVFHNGNGEITKKYLPRRGYADPSVRLKREALALKHFGALIAPSFIGISGLQLTQSFVEGESILEQNGLIDLNFEEMGELLRNIHTLVKRDPHLLKDWFYYNLKKDYNNNAKHTLDVFGIGKVDFDINWDEVYKLGTTRVHRDFWAANIIKNGKAPVVIDWELAGIGSPYEDFALIEINKYNMNLENFWKGYGMRPNQQTINEYAKARIIKSLGRRTLEEIQQDNTSDNFYTKMINLLQSLC